MSGADARFAGSIPEIYDGYMVPLLFDAYAADMARRVAAEHPASVLEVAAGSGVVTRHLAPLLSAAARYAVTDLNQPMLDRARQRQGEDARIEWRQADALALPLDDAGFDVVCCQFGVMFFPDRVAGYREARRVLKPGGRFLFNTWDGLARNDFARTVAAAVATMFPADPPQFFARTPHGYHDVGRIDAELREAGFVSVESATIERRSDAPSAQHAAVALCQGTPLRGEIEARAPGQLSAVTDRAAEALAAAYGAGPISGRTQAHVFVAHAG